MPGHLRVPGLTGDLPASLSAAALTGLLRGELGFTGVIISDALEMRAVSEPFGLPEAAVLAVAAGTDLLCLGRDQDQLTYLAVRDALVDAAAPPAGCPARGSRRPPPGSPTCGPGCGRDAAGGSRRPARPAGQPAVRLTSARRRTVRPVGLAAARRAVQA